MKPSLTAVVFEFMTYGFGILMVYHVWYRTRAIALSDCRKQRLDASDEPNRGRWLSTLLWGVVFGVAIEFILTAVSDYDYGPAFISFPNPLEPATRLPLWVGVGWGVVLYATTWTAQRLKQPPLARAVFAGLLAVSIDISLDPVATAFGLWCWYPKYANFYGVPYDNFICWFMIVTSYTGLVRLGFRRLGGLWGSTVWVPPIGAALAIGIVFLVDHFLPVVYEFNAIGDAPVFAALVGTAFAIVGRSPVRPPNELVVSGHILAFPIAYHTVCFLVLTLSGKYLESGLTSLVIVVPLALLVGVLGFGLGSLDRLFPRRQPSPA